MNKIVEITVSYNYFGDTVLTLGGEEYSMFQHNCRRAKELLKRVKALITQGCVCLIVEADYNFINIKPAGPYIEELIQLDEDAYEASKNAPFNNSAGAEIAGRYGY